MGVLAVVTADWHLAPGAWLSIPSLRGDAYFALDQVAHLCVETNAKALIGAGDLFDVNRPDSTSLAQAFNVVDYLRDNACEVLFIQGQHDLNTVPYLNLVSGTYYLNGYSKKVGDCHFYGIDYQLRSNLTAALRLVPRHTDVVICHQVWNEFMGFGVEGSLVDVPHAKMVITGDYHKHQDIIVKRGNFAELQVLSPGALCMQDRSEPPVHQVYLLHDNLSFESYRLKSRPFAEVYLHDREQLESWLASGALNHFLQPDTSLPEHMRKGIIRVHYLESIPGIYNDLRRAIADRVYIFWSPIQVETTTTTYSLEEAAIRVPQGIDACLEMVCSRASGEYGHLAGMLSSDRPGEILKKIVEDFR